MCDQIFNQCINNNPNYNDLDRKKWYRTNIAYKFAKFYNMEKEAWHLFFSAQLKYHVLLRFIHKCKASRWFIKYNNEYDLTYTPFTDIRETRKIEIVEDRHIYVFNMADLVKIIYSALTTHSFGFIKPKMPANPYTNKEFSMSTLYSIFAKIKNVKVPLLLWHFFDCQFSIQMLKQYHRKLLMRYATENNTNIDALDDIYELCYGYFNIHSDFPQERLYQIFRPYVVRYYKWNLLYCSRSKDELDIALRAFSIYNPHFGTKGEGGFDDRHLSFNEFLNTPFVEDEDVFRLAMTHREDYDSPHNMSLRPLFVPETDDEEDYDCDETYIGGEGDSDGSDDELGSYGYD